MSYHSQFGEDKWIQENLNPPLGSFCEVGAFDGIASSNSLFFEEQGWDGVLIEPDPFNAAKCLTNRSAVTWCCAAGPDGYQPFFVNLQDRGQSGLERPGKPFPVIVCRLETLIGRAGFRHVNLLSIDVEGNELDVWSTIGGVRPEIVIMEFLTADTPPRDKEIVYQMRQDGYREAHRTQANLIFTLD